MGRPREFDRTAALEAAMLVFWERGGYERTSIGQLTEAMDINAPSLYATFGSKRGLFDEAVELYAARPATPLTLALEEPTARRFVERLLDAAIEDCVNEQQPRGCLINTDPLLVDRRDNGRDVIAKRLARAVDEADLPDSANPAALAEFLIVVINGLSTRARDGASGDELRAVAAVAMGAWPAS